MHVGEIGRYLDLSLSTPLHTRTDGCRLAPHEVELGLQFNPIVDSVSIQRSAVRNQQQKHAAEGA